MFEVALKLIGPVLLSTAVRGEVGPHGEPWPFSPVVSFVAVLDIEIESLAAIIRGVRITGVSWVGNVYLYSVRMING